MKNKSQTVRLVWNKRMPAATACSELINWEYIYPHPVYDLNNIILNHNLSSDNKGRPYNRIIYGDNRKTMQALLNEGYKEKIDLIYIDPPYFSSSNYRSSIPIPGQPSLQRVAFPDRWENGLDSYLDMLYPRLLLMRELLKENGSIFVHLDWHVSHYVRILLDEIFGSDRLVNEIIWCYSGGAGTKRHFQRKHDVIFWYSKGDNYIFNPQYRPYSPQTLQRGLTRVKGPKYRLRNQGALIQDWWSDINKILSPNAYENLKFPTQKPVALLKRIIAAASNPGSLVADFFAGSGTLAQVAENMNRSWIIADNSELAVNTARLRLLQDNTRPFQIQTLEKKSENGQLVLMQPIIESYGSENILNVGIKNYKPEGLSDIDDFSRYIDYWELDLNYQDVFNSTLQILPTKRFADALALSVTVMVPPRNSYCIAVRVVDVWGKTATQVINITPS